MKNKNLIQILLACFLIVSTVLACGQFSSPSAPPVSQSAVTAVIVSETEANAGAKPGSPGLGDSLYPGFGNGGYDVKHYTLDITVNNVSTSDMTASTTIEANATANHTRCVARHDVF